MSDDKSATTFRKDIILFIKSESYVVMVARFALLICELEANLNAGFTAFGSTVKWSFPGAAVIAVTPSTAGGLSLAP